MADVKMVNLTIEGRAVSVPDGTSILEAAKYAGVLIPHYCYHPGLPVAGVCRMCLVEVEKAPKLAPSCATQAMEGQVVHVHSEKALEARKGVLEMLLINHPLDCPICDQAGECELQDYTFQEGRAEGRYRDPKRFNPVEDFGGDVVYVANRCILCTRCVRFMDDVAHDPVLSVAERGDRALIGKFEGQDLTHAWAGNVIDLCPVGALLSKDSLNKARAWEMDRAASVCPNCSQGCNMIVETRDNQVVRLRPRPNQAVNEYFMCDHGRLNYRWMNRQDRVSTPMVRQNGVLASADWEVALRAAATLLAGKKTFVLASPMLSNEALFLLGKLVDRTGGNGAFRVNQGEEAPLPGVEDLALRPDRAANVRGAELAGFTRSEAPLAGLKAGDVLVVADEELAGMDVADVARAGAVIVIGTTLPVWARHSAAIVLPIANMVEEDGTFTNLRGRVQRFLQAKAAPGIARPSFFVVGDLLAAMGEGQGYWTASAAFDALAAAKPAFAGMSYDTLGLKGSVAADVMAGAGA
ncbi:MAG: NADH:ubiquinone oxidoreductase, subunit iron-sulfur binding protein [Gemmatimonadetes bacterium]|jgi:NADH-quinone oxidoreductase subunit G|nr:NADH:ubiquinone oxidoreductase, subunit iron-sulfur binding protein [Gemmatimonadota bacterium]